MIPSPGLFEEAWWLDICSPGCWHTDIIDTPYAQARFTYAKRSRFGFICDIGRPPLTPFLGLSVVRNKEVDISKDLTLLSQVIPRFVNRLPRRYQFKLNFNPHFQWWSPFMWEGFSQHTRYTYRINDIQNLESVWGKFNSNIKRNIKKSEKSLTIIRDGSPHLLYSLFCKTMRNQGKKPGYDLSLLIALCGEIKKRNKGTILVAQDGKGRAHAAILIVWHNSECYYLVGGTDPELRSSGAMPLVMWNGIKLASEHATVFDFEGSMQKGIDKFIRNFGAVPCPYYQVSKFKIY